MTLSPAVGPFMGVVADKLRLFPNGRTFRVLIYQAYNAFGLIGTEKNGIAILDEDNRAVICDELARTMSGLSVPTRAQTELFQHLTDSEKGMSFEAVAELVNASDRARVQL
mgnify:CR=1 FL=1